MNVESYMPLFAAVTGVFMLYVSLLVVRLKDLVYASSSLAVLGVLNAILISMLGYYLVAAFLIIVYVGAAVMFIIITVSMMGGRDEEPRDEFKGMFAGATVATVMLLLVASLASYMGYSRPTAVSIQEVSKDLLGNHFFVLALIFIALAATLVEAIAITKRG